MPVNRSAWAATLLAILCWPSAASAQGLFLPGGGAANRAMAGASTAAPLDAAGAGYWNPAAISGLPNNEVYFGAELIYADTTITVEPLAPPGSVFSDTGLAALPTISMVYHLEDSSITMGLGVYAVVGGSVNFPTRRSALPLSANTNQYASAACLQLAPMLSVQLTERLALGLGPTVDIFTFSADPAFFAPNLDNSFPSATHGRPFWGGGFQAGLFYELNPWWQFGVSYKSPQWFETFRWHALDETGAAREVRLAQTLPWILSWGAAFRGLERTVIALDVRYFGYAGSEPYGKSVAEGGTAWDSIFAVAFGIQRQVSDRMKLRMGYLFNENPIHDVLTMFNTQLPAINQQQFSLGFSMRMTRSITMDFTWVHGFENSIRGPVPIQQIPGGATIGMTQSLDSWIFGTSVNF